MSRYSQLVLVQKAVLNPLLVVLIRIKIVFLEVLQKTRCDCTNALDIHLSARKLLLAVLYRVLQVFKSKYKLKKSFCVQLE